MKLTKKDVQHIAALARLELTNEELGAYGGQMSQVLDYMEELKEVDVTNVEPTAQIAGMINAAREDVADEWPDDEVESALGQAPSREGKYIKVKRVL